MDWLGRSEFVALCDLIGRSQWKTNLKKSFKRYYISEKDWKEVFPKGGYPDDVANGIKLSTKEEYEKWVTIWKQGQKAYQRDCQERIEKSGKTEEERGIETMLYMMNRSFEELKDKKKVIDKYSGVYDHLKDEMKDRILQTALGEFNKQH